MSKAEENKKKEGVHRHLYIDYRHDEAIIEYATNNKITYAKAVEKLAEAGLGKTNNKLKSLLSRRINIE